MYLWVYFQVLHLGACEQNNLKLNYGNYFSFGKTSKSNNILIS